MSEYVLREAFLLRDKKRCRWCESKEKLELHHLKHEKSTVDEVVTLCKKCHYRIHAIEKTLIDGVRVGFLCEKCYRVNGIESEILIHRISQPPNIKQIQYCLECGCGSIELLNAELVDSWVNNPFHDLMLQEYSKTQYSFLDDIDLMDYTNTLEIGDVSLLACGILINKGIKVWG